jgi:signal transduction histidine kinase
MRERVEAIGAQMEIQTQVGAGTHIVLTWKDVQE